MLGWGMYIGSRRELIWTLRNRAERAEAEQELRVSQARSNERARIAREMHDVLAHRISQISMHAGALAFRDDLTADEMRASAAVIQREGARGAHRPARRARRAPRRRHRRAARRARSRRTPTCPRWSPRPREAGLNVDARRTGSTPTATPVPDAVGRTVYRIVQEGITNARKHAPGALLTIAGQRLARTTASTSCCATRSASARPGRPGAGLGLVGLTERAELRGGRLEHRRDGSSVRAARLDTVGAA